MNNLSSYCALVDAKIRASDKDLPVLSTFFFKKGCALLNIKDMPLTFRPSTFSDKVLVCMPLAFKWQREGTAKEGRVCKYKVAPSSGPPPPSHCSSAFY